MNHVFRLHCGVLTESELGRIVEAAAFPSEWNGGNAFEEGVKKCVLGHARTPDLYDRNSVRYYELSRIMGEFDHLMVAVYCETRKDRNKQIAELVTLYGRVAKDELHARALKEQQRRNEVEAVLQEALRAPARRISRAEVQHAQRSPARAR